MNMNNKNDFAPTPPMGWNSYDYYDTAVNEEQVKANADYMAAHLRQHGWEYIVVDIQWYAIGAGSRRDEYQYIPFGEVAMDEYSRLLPDPSRFPSSADGAGFKPLADYIHGLGLKFGIHIMRGIPRIAAHRHCAVKGTEVTANDIAIPSSVCPWNPDMYGVKDTPAGQAYYDSLMELYASWGVDFIKCDDICRYDQPSCRDEVRMLAAAIRRCGRPIVLSLSPGPAIIDQAWYYETHANMWRITDDFWDNFDLLKNMFYRCELWQEHVSPGCYPDCDMLPIGRLGRGFGHEWTSNFTMDEARTMMTLWCLFGSPLMIGAELTLLDEDTLSLLTNDDLLAMLPPSVKPRQLSRDGEKAIWRADDPAADAHYVALFNLDEERQELSVSLEELGYGQQVSLTELWTGESRTAQRVISENIAPHACAVYRVVPM